MQIQTTCKYILPVFSIKIFQWNKLRTACTVYFAVFKSEAAFLDQYTEHTTTSYLAGFYGKVN